MRKQLPLIKKFLLNTGADTSLNEIAFQVPLGENWKVEQVSFIGTNSSARVMNTFIDRAGEEYPVHTRSVATQTIAYSDQVSVPMIENDRFKVKSATVGNTERFTVCLYGTIERID